MASSSRQAAGYQPVDQHDHPHSENAKHATHTPDDSPDDSPGPLASLLGPSRPSRTEQRWRLATYILSALVVLLLGIVVFLSLPLSFRWKDDDDDAGPGPCPCRPKHVPQYFQTSPELWPGPTATGRAAFMAQSGTWNPTATYVPNEPLQTSMPIDGMPSRNESIFRMMGFLSPYAPAPGFGVDEFPLPAGAEVLQLLMLSRHGARYPTSGSGVLKLGEKLANTSSSFKPQGSLAFLRDWKYELGVEVLVPRGRQELFESGVLHNYMYAGLYNPQSNIIVRTTTQDRMLKSAENWLAGFFGLEWTNNATIEVIIEKAGFNNSLAGSLNCPNSHNKTPGNVAQTTWMREYLQD
ncbi:hypothetical protein E4U53_005781, partial [Claviceps sorghi]